MLTPLVSLSGGLGRSGGAPSAFADDLRAGAERQVTARRALGRVATARRALGRVAAARRALRRTRTPRRIAPNVATGSDPYLSRSWRQTLRRFTPLSVQIRKATQQTRAPSSDGRDLVLPKDSEVITVLGAMHRREDLWGVGTTGYPARAERAERPAHAQP